MSCYQPLKAFPIGVFEKTGKTQYKICSYDTTFVYKKVNGETWFTSKDNFPGFVPGWIHVKDFVEIPCGKCIGCRLKYSRDWADRCVLESKLHDKNFFITLTYDDEHLPYSYSEDLLGKECFTPTLKKRDVQLFLKRLRKKFGVFRYFMCGEYGTHTLRPHYHLCVFGLNIPDLVEYKKSFNGDQYYNSTSISDIWSKGFVVIAPFNWETAAYTARYCLKKRNNNLSEFYESYNIEPEYVLMSRRPGLAAKYYEQHKDDIYDDDTLYMITNKGVQAHRPPRYFDKIYEQDFPEKFADLKENRKELSEKLTQLKLENTSLNYWEMLQTEEQLKVSRTKILNERRLGNDS